MAGNEALRKQLKAKGVTPKQPTVPISPLVTLLQNAVKSRKTVEKPTRPIPPASTGPLVGPASILRAETAGKYNFSDKARRSLSRVPIKVEDSAHGGAYYPARDDIVINRNMTQPYQQRVMAHEFGHQQWARKNDGWANEQDGSAYIADVLKLANDPRYPNMRQAFDQWAVDMQSPAYGGYIPTELDSRVIEHGQQGQQVPQWFRDKWGQDIWGGAPMGEGPQQQPTPGYRTPFGFVAQDRPAIASRPYTPNIADVWNNITQSYRPEIGPPYNPEDATNRWTDLLFSNNPWQRKW
jgi:hypothetical protein